MKLAFKTTKETYEYCVEVVQCFVLYCNTSEEEAIELVNKDWKDDGPFDENDYRLHEEPYYWAMCICHDRVLGDNRPDWFRDSALWPPPKAYFKRKYGIDIIQYRNGSKKKINRS